MSTSASSNSWRGALLGPTLKGVQKNLCILTVMHLFLPVLGQNVISTVTELSVAVAPAVAMVRQTFTIQPEVELLGANGQLINDTETSYTVQVVHREGATLLGNKIVAAVNGRAVFTDLRLDTTSNSHQLTFSMASGVGSPSNIDSQSFTVEVSFLIFCKSYSPC